MASCCGAVSTGRWYGMAWAGALGTAPSAATSSVRIAGARPVLARPLMLSRPLDPGRLQGLAHRHLHQGILGARLRDGTAVAIHAPVVTHPQCDRPQAQRLLAFQDALSA